MTDLDLLVAGALVSFLSAAGAYIAVRHRATELPASAYHEQDHGPAQTEYSPATATAPRSPQR